tara:strand:- start:5280 stop:5723 length:444 start_codon:yes stop_codon:yes gene_type:complete
MNINYIQEILSKDIDSLGYSIWGVEFFGRFSNQTLRIYIDNDKGITVQDCEKVSKHIINVLDAKDEFSKKYLLEISSPGLERKFFFKDQYYDYVNKYFKIKYLDDNNKKRTVKGYLEKVEDVNLYFKSDNEILEIPFLSIVQANLIM